MVNPYQDIDDVLNRATLRHALDETMNEGGRVSNEVLRQEVAKKRKEVDSRLEVEHEIANIVLPENTEAELENQVTGSVQRDDVDSGERYGDTELEEEVDSSQPVLPDEYEFNNLKPVEFSGAKKFATDGSVIQVRNFPSKLVDELRKLLSKFDTHGVSDERTFSKAISNGSILTAFVLAHLNIPDDFIEVDETTALALACFRRLDASGYVAYERSQQLKTSFDELSDQVKKMRSILKDVDVLVAASVQAQAYTFVDNFETISTLGQTKGFNVDFNNRSVIATLAHMEDAGKQFVAQRSQARGRQMQKM